MNSEASKSHSPSFVELKRVTWTKDSHGLFDYESKNVNLSKNRVETSSKIYKYDNEIQVEPIDGNESNMEVEDPNYLFSIVSDGAKNDKFTLLPPNINHYESEKQNLFLIVRSLKRDNGVQRGYTLELGDIIRLGRIEYRVIEYQDSASKRYSLFDLGDTMESGPFKLVVKQSQLDESVKHLCRICFMDETENPEILVNPCECKGTTGSIHVSCLQKWINSKVKHKTNQHSACSYWKHLICEICKTPLPDLLEANGSKVKLIPTLRPENPYMLVERIFYDKTKGGENSRMMILLTLNNEEHSLKLGRGHECDIRENDISVSRLHAWIKYQDSKFVIIDNNSKFGTLILLRREFEIEKRKIAVQVGRTVITFALKQAAKDSTSTAEGSYHPDEADLELKKYNMNDFDES